LTLAVRRIGAYGICRGPDGRVLLARASIEADFPGVWQIPGGGLDQGEDPAAGVVREFFEETGLTVAVTGVRAAVADVRLLGDLDTSLHTDRLIYDVTAVGGTLRDELSGTTDKVAWLTLDEAAAVPLMPFTATLLGLPETPLDEETPHPVGRVPYGPPPRDRGQRFAAYGLVTDPAGRVLLTLIAPGYPGAGRWHLPGGGTNHGEQPAEGLLRELQEEGGQVGRVEELMFVSHLHNPAAQGPEGHPMDWHAVRAVYRVSVDEPTPARVTEAAGGSTAEAGWFTRAEVATLRLTEVARAALRLSK
jgi:ADP-ribose pyrophosphatase YjhB (NUDIX family)